MKKEEMSGISNSEIRKIRSLSSKKFRDEYGLFTVEGEKMVAEALASEFVVEKVYRTDEIGKEAMSRISSLSSPSPVLALVRRPDSPVLESEEAAAAALGSGLYIALDSIRDPGNLGTILRIADYIFNPKVVQSTMGAIFRVKFRYADIPSLASAALKAGGRVYGTFLDGDSIYGADLDCGKEAPSVIVTGNEAAGISPEVSALVSDRLYIPPYPADDPGSESLNAAVATAVTIAEFRRRCI